MILNDAPVAEIISDALLRASDVSGRASFQREVIADALVNEATQLLCQGNAGVAGSERRLGYLGLGVSRSAIFVWPSVWSARTAAPHRSPL
jgi:hypothetical protein